MAQNSQGLVYCLWWNSDNIDQTTRDKVTDICNTVTVPNRIYSTIDEKTKYKIFKSQENKDAISNKEKLDEVFQNYKANSRAKVIPDTNEAKDYFFWRIFHNCILKQRGGKKSKKMRKHRKPRKVEKIKIELFLFNRSK